METQTRAKENVNLDEAFELTNSYFLLLNNENFNESRFEYIYLHNIFSLILVHQHYNFMHKTLNKMKDFNLVEVFRPIYFALVLLEEGKDSQEFLKAGPEIQETIEEIINEVNTVRNDFKKVSKKWNT